MRQPCLDPFRLGSVEAMRAQLKDQFDAIAARIDQLDESAQVRHWADQPALARAGHIAALARF